MITLLIESAIMFKVVICMPISKKMSQFTYKSQICNKHILRNGQLYQYCQKEYSLSSRVQTASITQSPASSVHLSLYTTTTQDLILNLTYSIQNLPSFSLFGLTNGISLQNSNISVNIPQDLSQGALLCLTCDVTANASDFTFVASGQNVSGAVLTPLSAFQLNQSLVQFRLNGVNVGGLVLNATKIAFTISICNISGYVGNQSVSGSIICFLFEQVSLGVDNVRVCANVQNFGQGSLSQTGTVTETCVVCREGSPAYGLCQKSLEFGKVEGDKFVCPLPFVFDGEGCSCQEGEVVNGTTCVNILTSVNLLKSQQIEINNSIVDLSNRTKVLKNTTGVLNASQVQMLLDSQSLYQLSNQTQNNIIQNSLQLQQFILENYSKAETNLQANITVLDKRIFDNISILSNQISTLNTTSLTLNQNITQLNQTLIAQQELSVLLSQNITLLNLTLTDSNNIIQQQQQIIQNLSLQIHCLNSGIKGQQLISGECRCPDNCIVQNSSCTQIYNFIDYIINGSGSSLSCSQQVYYIKFDIQTVTSSVTSSSNFSSGYVFNTTQNITNAFIDISDCVYSSTVNPLFQSQSSFTNLKIQFGAQFISSGSFISTQNTQITINQMNIVSKSGSQLTVSTNSQLNILSNSPADAGINNLLVNLSFAPSSGNITLINNINGVLNISGYQVLGDYNSAQTVAMIGINVQTATINLNQVCFKPNIYNVGNGSSYLFSNSDSGTSTFEINNLSVVIGDISNFLLLGSISTTTYDTNYYLFGGIIAYINTGSSISVYNVILDSFQKFSTSYVGYSGFFVGNISSSSSCIILKNVCLQQNITSTTLAFNWFGLIGENSGNISIQNGYLIFSVQVMELSCFGIIGIQDSTSRYAEVINLITSVNVISADQGVSIGSVFGYEGAQNGSVKNACIVKGSIQSGQNYVGGIIGCQNANTNLTIINSSVKNSTISGSNVVGGIIGGCRQGILYLTNTQIKFVRLSASGSNFGIVIGINIDETYSFINSSSSSNFLNNAKQTDCANFSNTWSISGC
ncbi:Hypothetical_protein [Hexamita inflata]|uniref:Hypothetical_protein n=1 Tax=Hexamita inflata TaxID=28002 RepID=A0AA86UJP4_9EUKA|nr:Hypothetical protein HINF_LOCUS46064 [Hexamita inflata]